MGSSRQAPKGAIDTWQTDAPPRLECQVVIIAPVAYHKWQPAELPKCQAGAVAGHSLETHARKGPCSRMLWMPLAVSGSRRGRVSVGSSNGRGRRFDRGTWGNRWQRGPSRRSWPIAALDSSLGRTERSTFFTEAPLRTSTHFGGANGFPSRRSRARKAPALVASGCCRGPTRREPPDQVWGTAP